MDVIELFNAGYSGLTSEVGAVWAISILMLFVMSATQFMTSRGVWRSSKEHSETRAIMDKLTSSMYESSQKDDREKADLYKQLADVRVRVATLDSEYVTYKNMAERIIQSQKQLHDKERDERMQERERYRKEIELLKEQIRNLRDEKNALLLRLTDIEARQGELVEQLSRIQLDSDSLRDQRDQREIQNQRQADEIQELKRCIDELRSENNGLRKRIEEIEHEKKDIPIIVIQESVNETPQDTSIIDRSADATVDAVADSSAGHGDNGSDDGTDAGSNAGIASG